MKYRKGIGIFLVNSEKKLWVGKRIDNKNNFWQMPQGGIDKYETEEQAMKREMFEEVGINDNYEMAAVVETPNDYEGCIVFRTFNMQLNRNLKPGSNT